MLYHIPRVGTGNYDYLRESTTRHENKRFTDQIQSAPLNSNSKVFLRIRQGYEYVEVLSVSLFQRKSLKTSKLQIKQGRLYYTLYVNYINLKMWVLNHSSLIHFINSRNLKNSSRILYPHLFNALYADPVFSTFVSTKMCYLRFGALCNRVNSMQKCKTSMDSLKNIINVNLTIICRLILPTILLHSAHLVLNRV